MGRQFKIIDRDKNNIAGVKSLQADWINVIHVNLKEKEFSILYASDTGETLTFGKCYGN